MPPSGTARVLIVEDESVVALSLADVLQDEGFTVIGPISSQAEALTVLENTRPDVVILDLGLQDGFCAHLAKKLHRRGVPFVVFSGYRQDHTRAEFRDAPWIEKPGTIAAILAGIATAMNAGGTVSKGRT